MTQLTRIDRPADPNPRHSGALGRSSLGRAVARAYSALLFTMTLAAILATLAILAVMLREIIGRYFFGRPTGWADEVAGYLVGVLAFLGAAHSMRAGHLLTVELLVDRLSRRVRGLVIGIGLLLSLAGGILLLYYMVRYSLDNFDAGRKSFTTLQFPLWIPQMANACAFAVLLLELGRQAVVNLFDLDGVQPVDEIIETGI